MSTDADKMPYRMLRDYRTREPSGAVENMGLRRSHWIAGPAVPLGHEALLTLARKVRAAACDTDPERLAEAARRFSMALEGHVQAEVRSMGRMVPAEARVLMKGQDRICAIAADLVDQANRGCAIQPRDCLSRSQELVALLSLQARDEEHTLDRSIA